jgi:hypothetical protein
MASERIGCCSLLNNGGYARFPDNTARVGVSVRQCLEQQDAELETRTNDDADDDLLTDKKRIHSGDLTDEPGKDRSPEVLNAMRLARCDLAAPDTYGLRQLPTENVGAFSIVQSRWSRPRSPSRTASDRPTVHRWRRTDTCSDWFGEQPWQDLLLFARYSSCTSMGTMTRDSWQVVCGWCDVVVRAAPAGSDTTHTICPSCFAVLRDQIAAVARVKVEGAILSGRHDPVR